MEKKYLTKGQVKQMNLKEGELVLIVHEQRARKGDNSRFPRDTSVGYYRGLWSGDEAEEVGIGLTHNQLGNRTAPYEFRINNGIVEIRRKPIN